MKSPKWCAFGGALAAGVLSALLLTGCQQEPQSAQAAQAPSAMPVSVQVVAAVELPLVIEAVGQTESANEVAVHARVSGMIERQQYQEGATIEVGAPMFVLEKVPYEIPLAKARANLAQKTVLRDQARSEEQRLKALTSTNAVSEREYDAARFAAELAAANILLAEAEVREAELNLSYTEVMAPASGIAGRALQTTGNLVSTAGDTLLTHIIQVDPIRVQFSLSESDVDAVRGSLLSDNATSKVNLVLGDGQAYPHVGQLNFTASEIDARFGTLRLRAEFPNPDMSLLPGQFVRVKLTSPVSRSVVLIPKAVVMQSDQGFFVYVVSEQQTAAIRPIETGRWEGDQWVVLKGLTPGDQVITDNLLKLRPGAPIMVQPPAQPAKDAP